MILLLYCTLVIPKVPHAMQIQQYPVEGTHMDDIIHVHTFADAELESTRACPYVEATD